MTDKEMELAQQLSAAVNSSNEVKEEAVSEIEESIDESPAEQQEEPKQNSDVEEFESLKRELSGLSSDQIELVKSITNKEDRQKAIELAKRQRADKDRLHLELGNTKKELERMNSFLQQLENQRQAGVSQGVDENLPEDDYLTESERTLKNKIIQLENQYKQIDQKRLNAENAEIIAEFQDEKPDFIELEADIALAVDVLNKKKGVPFTIKERRSRLEEAYKLAKSFNNADKTEAELERLKQQEELRQQKIEESKKLKKFSRTGSPAPQNLTPDQKVAEMWKEFFR